MPNLDSLIPKYVVPWQNKNYEANAKIYRTRTQEITAWYNVCDNKESKLPFAVVIVKLPVEESDKPELYIDNRLASGADGSDGIVDRYFRQFDLDTPILDYFPRCPVHG